MFDQIKLWDPFWTQGLIVHVQKSLYVCSTSKKFSDVFEEPVKNYSNIHDIDKELEEIKNRTKAIDQTSAFAIAMSAKHKTLTKK